MHWETRSFPKITLILEEVNLVLFTKVKTLIFVFPCEQLLHVLAQVYTLTQDLYIVITQYDFLRTDYQLKMNNSSNQILSPPNSMSATHSSSVRGGIYLGLALHIVLVPLILMVFPIQLRVFKRNITCAALV